MRFRTLVPAMLGLALLLPPAAALAGPADPPQPQATVEVQLNGCQMVGQASSIPGNQLTVKLRSAAGVLKRTADVTVNGSSWEVACPGPRVRGGDRITLFATGATTPFRTFVVPRLKLRTDRVRNVLAGNAPGNPDSARVGVSPCDPTLTFCAKTLPISVNPRGSTSAFSIGTGDIKGGNKARLLWQKGNDIVSLEQPVARLVVRPGSATVSGHGSSVGQSVTLTLRRGQAIGKATRTTGPDAAFSGKLRRAGSQMKVKAGDRVSGSFASDAVMKVPTTSLTFDFDSIDGQCFRNAPVSVQLFNVLGALISIDQVTSNDSGVWTLPVTLLAGTTIRAWCANARGDIVLNELLAV